MKSFDQQIQSLENERQRKMLKLWLLGICFVLGILGILADQSLARVWAVLGTAIPLSLACMFAADINGIKRTIKVLEFIRGQQAQSNSIPVSQ